MLRPGRTAALVAALTLLATTACRDGASPPATATNGAGSPAATSGVATVVPFATTSTSPAAAASVNTAALIKQVRPSVVRVRASAGSFAGQTAQGTGTGFVVDARGYIVTNNHVVTIGGGRTATSLKVDLSDGRTLDATLVGRDERTDLAVIKVDGGDFSALRFADPAGIEVGEDVVAVGFALDLGGQPTVTKGVVSALDRTIDEQLDNGAAVSISGAIQTDAAINPGNSGGPLIDAEGNVVGINTAGLRGGYGESVQGISFAVSSGVAQPIVSSLLQDGSVRRGYLGVVVTTIDRARAEALRLPVNEGVRIERVDPNTPAAKAGLQTGDIITKIGDVAITNIGDLTTALTRYKPGQTVKAEYARGSDTRTVDITPGDRPDAT
jgi:S1-C subfamily serine protease